MPWPPRVLDDFSRVPTSRIESNFHGAYNMLLRTLFPLGTGFTIAPYLLPASPGSPKSILAFKVLRWNEPILVLELKRHTHFQFSSAREAVDERFQSPLDELAACCPLPFLHAVSVIGTRLRFHKISYGDVGPRWIPAHSEATDAELWDCDIFEDEGEKKFLGMVDEIKQACAAL